MNCNFAIELTNHPHPPVTDDYDDDGTLVRANWNCSYLSIASDNSPRVSNIGKNENRQNWWWPTTSPVVLWLMLPLDPLATGEAIKMRNERRVCSFIVARKLATRHRPSKSRERNGTTKYGPVLTDLAAASPLPVVLTCHSLKLTELFCNPDQKPLPNVIVTKDTQELKR